MEEIEIVDSYLMTCTNLQLAMTPAKVDIRILYSNLHKYSVTVGFDLSEFNFANYLNFIEAHRVQFDMCDGEIGAKVNLVGLKKEQPVQQTPDDPDQKNLFPE